MNTLSKRLTSVAMMVTPGTVMADVGTDHGYVPIYLVKNNICEKAYALDVNMGPLNRAVEHIENEGLTGRIITIQSDGMAGLVGVHVDSVVVAGMGGELICNILENSPILGELKELILSPHSEVEKVRRKIQEVGFLIIDEKMVEDCGKFYNIIKAVRTDKVEHYSDFDYLYSRKLFENKDQVFLNYLYKTKEKCQNIIELLNNNKQGVSERNFELRKQLENCNKAIAKFENE